MTAQRWRIVLWGGTSLAICVVAWEARHALLPFVLGTVLAYALSPLVDWLAGLMPAHTQRADVWRRGIAVTVIYVGFFVALALAALLLVPVAANQISQFVNQLPSIVDQARGHVVDWFSEYERRAPPEVQQRVNGMLDRAAALVADLAGAGAQRSLQALSQTLSLLFGFAIVPFWMFYAMRDRHFVATNILRALPPPAREDARQITRLSDTLLGRYIRGQLLLALVVGAAVGLSLTVLGVQLSMGLGLWAGLTELIPIIGPWLGAIPGLIVVAATEPDLLPWVALVYLVVQQLENNLLVPRVQGHAVDLHPAMIVLLLAAAGAVWGLIGLIVVIPLAAILRELFWYADRRLTGRTPAESFAASHVGHHALRGTRDTPDGRATDEG